MMDPIEALIEQHQDYVRKLARGIARKLPDRVDFDELVGYGQLGLVEAANQYDFRQGVAFTTFAYYRIRGAIFDGLRKMAWLPPNSQKELTQSIAQDQVSQDISDSRSQNQDPEFAAKQFEEAVRRLGAVFLVSQVAEEDRPLEPTEHGRPEDGLEQRELLQRLAKAVAALPPEHHRIIELLYFEQKSMSEIGQLLKKNKSTVCRQHAKALDALKDAILGAEV